MTAKREYIPRHAASAHARNSAGTSVERGASPQTSGSELYDFDHQYDNIPFLSTAFDQQPGRSESVRRPLIDLVTNEWKNKPHADEDDLEYYGKETWKEPTIIAVLKARKVRRLIMIWVLVILFVWLLWRYGLKPAWEEQRLLTESVETVKRHKKHGRLQYGINATPSFRDLIQLKDLDQRLVPQPGRQDDKRRLIIVGDVHGCKEELLALLEKVSSRPSRDHLIFTGDIIAKGPDSSGVVDIARNLQASCVRGNHEDRMLLAWDAHQERLSALTGTPDEQQQNNRLIEEEESASQGSGGKKGLALAKHLSKAQIHWLKQCPVILRIGHIKGMGEVSVVHAGIVPGVELENVDPYHAMTMRTIDLDTHMPSEKRDGMPWEKVWNHYQKTMKPEERKTVVYGHDSKRGLSIRRWSKGLDSGCVNGGRLTALVVEGGEREVDTRIVSVKCRMKYT